MRQDHDQNDKGLPEACGGLFSAYEACERVFAAAPVAAVAAFLRRSHVALQQRIGVVEEAFAPKKVNGQFNRFDDLSYDSAKTDDS